VDTSKLAPETRRVWEFLSSLPALGGFVLIGGTALAMHIAHRVSEDLDFITVGNKLPRAALNGLVMILERDGFIVERDDDQAAYEEFLIAGESLHDYQQNFLIDGVKVNIFAPDPDLGGMIETSREPLVRVASLPELFRTKALAAANRCVSRDWIDLYALLRSQGFTLADFHEAFQRPNIHNPAQRISQAFQNLCRGVKSVTDPGYETLAPDAPSLMELAKYFTALRDAYQTEQSRVTFQQRKRTEA
jgi:hypothetical protein